MKGEEHTPHLLVELVNTPPDKGEEDKPDEDPADPVLCLSMDEADDVPEEMPEDDLCPPREWEKASRTWSSPHRANAPFRESIEGVGELISPDFCLTIP